MSNGCIKCRIKAGALRQKPMSEDFSTKILPYFLEIIMSQNLYLYDVSQGNGKMRTFEVPDPGRTNYTVFQLNEPKDLQDKSKIIPINIHLIEVHFNKLYDDYILYLLDHPNLEDVTLINHECGVDHVTENEVDYGYAEEFLEILSYTKHDPRCLIQWMAIEVVETLGKKIDPRILDISSKDNYRRSLVTQLKGILTNKYIDSYMSKFSGICSDKCNYSNKLSSNIMGEIINFDILHMRNELIGNQVGNCQVCHLETRNQCGGCTKRYICGKECQKVDWVEHRISCGKK